MHIIVARLIFGRFGLHGLGGPSVPISKDNKATGAIADVHIPKKKY
jgi:hypothetical protein